VTAYSLVAASPKLTKADPANRTGWKNGPALGARDPRDNNPILSRLVDVPEHVDGRNWRAALSRHPRPATFALPVVDETRQLGGKLGLHVSRFTPKTVSAALANGGGGRGTAGGRLARAPLRQAHRTRAVAVSLYDALNQASSGYGCRCRSVRLPRARGRPPPSRGLQTD